MAHPAFQPVNVAGAGAGGAHRSGLGPLFHILLYVGSSSWEGGAQHSISSAPTMQDSTLTPFHLSACPNSTLWWTFCGYVVCPFSLTPFSVFGDTSTPSHGRVTQGTSLMV